MLASQAVLSWCAGFYVLPARSAQFDIVKRTAHLARHPCRNRLDRSGVRDSRSSSATYGTACSSAGLGSRSHWAADSSPGPGRRYPVFAPCSRFHLGERSPGRDRRKAWRRSLPGTLETGYCRLGQPANRSFLCLTLFYVAGRSLTIRPTADAPYCESPARRAFRLRISSDSGSPCTKSARCQEFASSRSCHRPRVRRR